MRVNILVLKIETISCAGNVRVNILVPVLFFGSKLVLLKLVVLNLVPLKLVVLNLVPRY